MAEASGELEGPDFEKGCKIDQVADGEMFLGHAFGEQVLVARRGDELFAIGATCTHYGGPLAKGLVVDCTVHCPWHHARFDLRTGEAIAAPALNNVACYKIDKREAQFFVTSKIDEKPVRKPKSSPASVVIVGAGAAGGAAAEMLRREGYDRPVRLIGADEFLPYDRTNLSKDYLAGTASEEWIPLRSADFYREQKVETFTNTSASAIDTRRRQVTLSDGRSLSYGALLLATGAKPVRLQIPGDDLSHVCYLRTLADSRHIIAKAENAKRAVVIGASFIGLEVAASLRERKLEVAVVGKGSLPLEKILGAREQFVAPPFFWSNHFDLAIRYVGHGSRNDRAVVSGDLKAKDASVIFRAGDKLTAVASIGRDLENLKAELALERGEEFRPS